MDLGAEACAVELELCGEPIGKHDQYAAAVGGLNIIEFHPDDSVSVEPVVAPPGTVRRVEDELVMFYTGGVRSASAILKQQAEEVGADAAKRRALERMVELVYVLRGELSSGNADAVGEILHENWLLKRSLTSGISSAEIDDIYDTARRAGATGGKLLGAGGGGFMVFSVPEGRRQDVIAGLARLRHVPFRFDRAGASIAFYQSGKPEAGA